MRVGVVTELKNHEDRVALTPAGVATLVADGHEVVVEAGAGQGSHFADDEYRTSGARLYETATDVWEDADLLLKVKEPVAAEYARMRAGQVLFTYLHLAADRETTEAILASGTTAIAYETVEGADGGLPLLAPMSEVAGRLATQVGAYHLMAPAGGRGVLLGGVPGVPPAEVVVLGGGVSGTHAATIALGMGARVSVLDLSLPRLRELDEQFGGRLTTLASNPQVIEEQLLQADLVIGAVLVPGARAPTLVSNELVARLRPGSVLVDISIDQGGCFEDSRPTTHDEPTFRVHDSVFYCVANMPGSVPRTSTLALTNATLPYVRRLAGDGWRTALQADRGFAAGLNAHAGELTQPAVGDALGIDAVTLESVLRGSGRNGRRESPDVT
ncbi:alanine dehydrogenase [Aeromicrobium sp. PE09-221]|uniref:alanine dehydrogenase n=1 Tax=Aeromicrobium sp. PE09-221 TaxID=1898043 RepID=UPI000B3EAC88|nr:alanine dehydrogenase [Aeromicrobium sp. PE09-221]OUZ11216.1 alanine dehydrogenase [Aeromicrobium sp. PE09-221]